MCVFLCGSSLLKQIHLKESEVILKMVLLLVKLKGIKIFIHQEMVTRNVNYIYIYICISFIHSPLTFWKYDEQGIRY